VQRQSVFIRQPKRFSQKGLFPLSAGRALYGEYIGGIEVFREKQEGNTSSTLREK